jgi:hypothetical protein
MQQAHGWHWEQLLDLWQRWELCQKQRLDTRLLAMTQPLTMISDAVLGVENNENTAMGTLPSSQTLALTSHLHSINSHCKDLFHPAVWCDLTSVMHKPQCWQ